MSNSVDKSKWIDYSLEDLVTHVTESTKDPASEGIERLVGLEHLEPKALFISKWGELSAGTTFTKKFKKGDVLFGRRRAYQKKAAVADFNGVCSGDIIVMRAKDKTIIPELLPFVIQNDRFFEFAVKTSAGSLSPRTKFKDLKSYKVKLPPIGEQDDIYETIRKYLDTHSKLRTLSSDLTDLKTVASSLDSIQVYINQSNKSVDLMSLGDLEDAGIIKLGRGNVISKKDIEKMPGDYPIYSSSAQGKGEFGKYGKYMFDEELITWSVDGGGRFFYRDKHRYSVTNVSGWMRVNDKNLVNIKYLFYVLDSAWRAKTFNYVMKAHPSVIRTAYEVPLPPREVQDKVVERIDQIEKIQSYVNIRDSKLIELGNSLIAEVL